MTDGDDKVKQHYRALGGAEPPAALDQAILAASRRAVAPRRASQRWAMPVSLAAVLVLALGVTLRMQREEPGIEVSAPASEYSLPPSATTAEAPRAEAPRAEAPRPEADSPKKQVAKPEAAPMLQKRANELVQKKDKALARDNAAQSRPEAFVERQELAAAPAPAEPAASARQSPPSTTIGSSAAPPPAPAAPAQQAMRAGKREARAALADAQEAKVAEDPRVRELERIAQLRRDGKHSEADEALAKFRREHPDYRIEDALWERVRPAR